MNSEKFTWEESQDKYVAWTLQGQDKWPEKDVNLWLHYIELICDLGRKFKSFVSSDVGVNNGFSLDLACGSDTIFGESYEVIGYDYGNYDVGLDPLPCHDRFERFVQAIGEHIPFRSSCFDTVVIATSLDHLIDMNQVFEEVYRILKGTGRFFIWITVFDQLYLLNNPDPYHANRLTSRRLYRTLEENHFQIKREFKEPYDNTTMAQTVFLECKLLGKV